MKLPLSQLVRAPVKHLGFRGRLFLILALIAIVPSLVLTLAWGSAMVPLFRVVGGTTAWDSAAASGARALAIARRGPLTAADERELARHDSVLSVSLTRARQFGFIARGAWLPLLVLSLVAIGILALLVSRAAGHLSRQLSRPLHELVGWTERIGRGEPLPPEGSVRGAPEFALLRERMRRLSAELEAGRAAALEAERLAAFRESARQVAHELKNPLTPIRFAVDRLKREAPPHLSDTVEVLSSEAARLEVMARSFAQFGRLPEGPMAEVDLGEVVRSAVRTTVPPSIPCSVEVAAIPTIIGHHDAIGRAVTNVLLNAVEACGAAGRISAGVEERNGARREVVIVVRDSGPGIAPAKLATIWEPYVTHKPGGTGLGLAIVKQTVSAHGGRVEAQSAPGMGTEIRLVFPVPDHAAGSGDRSPSQETEGRAVT